MKKLLALILLTPFVSLSQQPFCKDDLFPRQDKNRLWGYSNLNGDWIVKPYYDKVARFNGSIAIVNRRSHYGAVNCEGKLVFQCDYDEMLPFMSGYSWASKEGKWGLLKYDGKTVLQPQYDEVEELSTFSPYSLVRKGDVWLLFDKYKEELIPQEITEYELYYNNYLHLTYTSGKQALLNLREQVFVRDQLDSLSTKKGRVYHVVNKGRHYLMRYTGEAISDSVDFLEKRKYGKYVAKKNGKWALWSRAGVPLTKYEYDNIEEFSEGAAVVTINGKKGYLTASGKLAIPLEYDEAYPVDNRIAVVKKGDSTYMISRKNKRLSGGYDFISHKNNSNYYVGIIGGDHWILSEFGKPFVKNSFDSVVWTDTYPFVRVKNKTYYRIIDLRTGNMSTRDNVISYKTVEDVRTNSIHENLLLASTREDLQCIPYFDLCDSTGKVLYPGFDSPLTYSDGNKWLFAFNGGVTNRLVTEGGDVLFETVDYIKLQGSDYLLGLINKKKAGVVNVKTKVLVYKQQYEDVQVIAQNFVAVFKKGWFIGDNKGNLLNEDPFEFVAPFASENLVGIKIKGKLGFFSLRSKKVVIAPKFDEFVSGFENGVAQVSFKGKTVRINIRGQVIQ